MVDSRENPLDFEFADPVVSAYLEICFWALFVLYAALKIRSWWIRFGNFMYRIEEAETR